MAAHGHVLPVDPVPVAVTSKMDMATGTPAAFLGWRNRASCS
ncbi:hypothetical protein [Haloechinothrix halophila]|nr:hypothetical protein [Haloechinothrix halophila]